MKERRDEERNYSVPGGNNPIHKAPPNPDYSQIFLIEPGIEYFRFLLGESA
ncbi:MAG: hypothetical protein WC769_07970 [Thermodesulfovibrionales bacterium]|jgi:hypothetical protein